MGYGQWLSNTGSEATVHDVYPRGIVEIVECPNKQEKRGRTEVQMSDDNDRET